MMNNKIYKYRPLSDILFKELFYNELYFASYGELNDPLDLSTHLDFSTQNPKDLINLLYSIIKTTIISSYRKIRVIPSIEKERLINFRNDKTEVYSFCNKLFKSVEHIENLPYEKIAYEIKKIANEKNLDLFLDLYKDEINRLTNVFFKNSSVTCFSETNSNFLMWSHYASKHQGICLEFTLNEFGEFPYIININRNHNPEISTIESKEVIYWERLNKVKYEDKILPINYFAIFPIFANEHDCDLINLSKSQWYPYATYLENIFCIKTKLWEYEKEWRSIELNFKEPRQPEKRIRHYPPEALSKIFFGIRTPNEIKERIYQLINTQNPNTKFFTSILTNNGSLEFQQWQSGLD